MEERKEDRPRGCKLCATNVEDDSRRRSRLSCNQVRFISIRKSFDEVSQIFADLVELVQFVQFVAESVQIIELREIAQLVQLVELVKLL